MRHTAEREARQRFNLHVKAAEPVELDMPNLSARACTVASSKPFGAVILSSPLIDHTLCIHHSPTQSV